MLNNKQKKYLMALANKERAVFQIGKEGLSFNLCNAIADYLRVNELVKVSILKSAGVEVREAAIEIASTIDCDVVKTIGRVIILYKKAKEPKIELPC